MKYTKFIAVLLILSLTISTSITAKPVSAQSDVTLTMWTWKQFHIPGLEAAGKAFTEKTGIKVKVEVYNPDDAYRTKVQAASQSGDLPDVLAWWSNGQWDLAAAGLLTELSVDEAWAKTFMPGTYEKTSVWTQQLFDNCKGDKTCQRTNLKVGQVFSVPMAAGSFFIVYANRSMLKQAGVDPNIVPKDTNEFLDVMEKVYKATGKGATIGGKFQDILRNWIVAALAVTNCGPKKFVAMLNGEPDVSFTDKCSADAFQFIGDMVKRNLWQDGLQTLTIDQADVAFAQGKAAFDFGGSFTLGFLLQQGMKPEDILTFTLPALPTSQQKPIELAPFALIDLAVTKDSKHVKEATDFIKFFTSADQMAAFAKITGDLPSVPISTDPKVVGDLMATMSKSYVNAGKSLLAGWNDAVVASPDVYAATDSVCNKLITGEGTLADSLKAADDAAHQDRTRRTK